MIVGPWHHTAIDHPRQGDLRFPAAAGRGAETASRFLDRWLSGAPDDGFDPARPVRYFVVGEDVWIDAGSWPPPDTQLGRPGEPPDAHVDAAQLPATSPRSSMRSAEVPFPGLNGWW